MAMIKAERKKRLLTLEGQIRKNLEAFVIVGNALAEIQEKRLYLEHVDVDGESLYPTWTVYLDKKVSIEFNVEKRHAQRLIAAAQTRPRLPDLATHGSRGWNWREVEAFKDLAPQSTDHSQRYDFHRIDKQQAKRVTKTAIDLAGGVENLNSTFIKKAIRQELGEDEPQQKKQEPKQDGIALDDYLRRIKGTSEGWLSTLENVPADAWESYARELDGATAALEQLLSFLKGE